MTQKKHPGRPKLLPHQRSNKLKVGVRIDQECVDIKNKYAKDWKYTLFINIVIKEWAGFKKNQENILNN